MELSQKEILQLEKGWNQETKQGVGTGTFGGRIQFTGDRKKGLERLRALESFKSEKSAQALEEPPSQVLPPEVEAQPEDFVDVTYRALSAAILGDRPIDFRKEAMLKKGVRLLNGQTVFKDHNTSVDNWVGRVISTSWDSETPGLPPGINAVFRLDMVKDPMAVRGVLQGAIHSASVTVSFQWVPSHPKLMDEGRFFQNLGETIEGEMVRVIVSKIEKFWEISLVWQGADEFAKQIDENGNPLNMYEKQDEESLVSLEKIVSVTEKNVSYYKQEEPMSEKLKAAFKKVFGAEVTEENFEELASKFAFDHAAARMKAAAKEKEELELKLVDANKKSEELEKKISALTPQAELGAAHLKSVRDEAARLYKVSKGSEAKEVILKTLADASLEIAVAWKEEFEAEVEAKFPQKCQDCGSAKVSRQSSKGEEALEERNENNVVQFNPALASNLRNLHG